MKFTYSVVRYVPDTARGEFVNVGVLLFNTQDGTWRFRQVSDWSRAQKFGTIGSLASLKSVLEDVHYAIHADLFSEAAADSWLSKLHSDHRNVVQFTEPSSLSAVDPDQALKIAWETFIFEHASTHRLPSKQGVHGTMRKEFLKVLDSRLRVKEHVKLEVGSYAAKFDFAINNGRVIQLVNTWSFAVSGQENLDENVRAWAWTVGALRKDKDAIISGSKMRVPGEIDIEVVYLPPVGGVSEVFSMAQKVFADLNVKSVEVTSAHEVAERALALATY